MFSTTGRLARDSELRFTPKGDPVLGFSIGYDCGYGDKKRTNWVDCALWGKQAEALAPYMTKGQQVFLVLDDFGMETYQTRDGIEKAKLTGKVAKIQLVGSKGEKQTPAKSDLEDMPF